MTVTVPCKLFEIITTRNFQLLTSSKLITVTISEGKRERERFYPERNRIPNIVLAEAAVRRCFSK